MAHIVQGLTDLDADTTLLSVDGIGAFDLVSRAAMMRGLLEVGGGGSALPFVRQFYGSPSTYWWDDEEGVTHEIRQGEGGEQGHSAFMQRCALSIAVCCQMSVFLLFWTTFTPCVGLNVCPMCTWRSKKSCGPIHGFKSIKGKHNCGTGRVRLQAVGKLSLPPPVFRTPRQSCGGVIPLSPC